LNERGGFEPFDMELFRGERRKAGLYGAAEGLFA
jgi:hypothetical protein